MWSVQRYAVFFVCFSLSLVWAVSEESFSEEAAAENSAETVIFTAPLANDTDTQLLLDGRDVDSTKKLMVYGVGGVCLANFPNRPLMIENTISYVCHGQLYMQPPYCYNRKSVFYVRQSSDYCYSIAFVQLWNYICVGQPSTQGLYFRVENGHPICVSNDNQPTLVLTKDEYWRKCGFLPNHVEFYYFPNINDPSHVHLPNRRLGCKEERRDLCVFSV